MSYGDNNARVYLSIALLRTVGVSAGRKVEMEIEIRDQLSSQAIFIAKIEPQVFIELLAGTHHQVDGWVCPPHLRGRIGQKMVVNEQDIPTDIIPRFDQGHVGGVATKGYIQAEEWAAEQMALGGWHDFDLHHHNNGWACVFRKWEPVEEADAPA